MLSPARSSAFERITFSALRPKTPLFGLEVMAWMAEQSLHVEWIGPELGFTQFEYELRKLLAAHEAESAEGARLSGLVAHFSGADVMSNTSSPPPMI